MSSSQNVPGDVADDCSAPNWYLVAPVAVNASEELLCVSTAVLESIVVKRRQSACPADASILT
jgi:hypothetical protein